MGLSRMGEKNPLWQGGISFEPYGKEFNEQLKEQIRKRDNYSCKLCGKQQNGVRLDVHHIDYIKKHNDPSNLISLCHLCHLKTSHKHREHWTVYFQILIKEAGF